MMEMVFYIIAKVISLMLAAISLAMSTRIIMQIVARMTSYDIEGNKFFIFWGMLSSFDFVLKKILVV